MARPAESIRNAAQAIWPGASVAGRGRNWIEHAHPTDPARRMLDIVIGAIHYGPNADTEISTAWTSTSGVWQHQMTGADFEARAKAAFNGAPLVEYRVGSDWVTLQPRQLEWHNDRGDVLVAGGVANVTASATDDTLRWTAAYGAGRHFEYQAQATRLAKKIILDSYASMPAPSTQILTGGNPVLRAQFQFAWSTTLSIFVDNVFWPGGGGSPTLTTANHIEFRNAAGAVVFAFGAPHTTDANGNDAPGMVLRVSRSGPNILVETRTPQVWLQSASYPVIVDPTIDVQIASDSDDAREASGTILLSSAAIIDSLDHYYGHRWPVTIPAGATIDTAWIDLFITNNNADEPNHTIYFEKNATPATFVVSANNISSRTPTTATALMSSTDLGASSSGGWLSALVTMPFPELKTIVQELVDSYDYSAGGFMVCIIRGSATATRDLARHDLTSGGNAAKLHIEYTAGGGGGAFSLTADVGAFTVTGQAANLLAGRRLSADLASYALAGIDANLLRSYVLAAEVGAFTLTGQDATLEHGTVGAFTLTADAATYTLAGQDANLLAGRALAADVGDFTITGQDASLLAGRILEAAAGSYALTGHDAALLAARTLTAAPTAFTLTWQDASLVYNPVGAYSLTAEVGAFALTGQDANLLAARIMAAEVAGYTLTGLDANLVYAPAGAFVLSADAATFTLTGQPANLLAHRVVVAEAGAYNLTGLDATLLAARLLSATTGAYVLTGQDAGLVYTPLGAFVLSAGTGIFTLAGQSVGLIYSGIYVPVVPAGRVYVVPLDIRIRSVPTENRTTFVEA